MLPFIYDYNGIDQDAIKTLFSYDSVTGELTWRVCPSNNVKIGSKAGYRDLNTGYLTVRINKRLCLVHRVIFLWWHGWLPPEVDHINCIRHDNKINNLRPATRVANAQNSRIGKSNTSGHKGVMWHRSKRRWLSVIQLNYKRVHSRSFITYEEAVADNIRAREYWHGYYTRHE